VANTVHTTKGSTISWVNNLKVDVVAMSATEFAFRFSDGLGNPINGLALQNEYTTLELIFKIQI
jgi:hypothetical protein